MKNKKGFTLIELLAVIIILGVLMIIAIPSVTTYIQNSRKSAFVDTASAYVDAVRNKTNEAAKIKLYATDTLYLIPVGHEKAKACISVETGGQSPFSDEWAFAYVGVTYDGEGYNYYFIGEDGAAQGLPFMDQKTLTDDGTEKLYSEVAHNPNSGINSTLKTLYGTTSDTEINGVKSNYKDASTELKELIGQGGTSYTGNSVSGKTKVQVIYAGNCTNMS